MDFGTIRVKLEVSQLTSCIKPFNSQACQKLKFLKISRILFCSNFIILKNKCYYAKVPQKRFDLNGHAIGFCPQTLKLVLHNCISVNDSESERDKIALYSQTIKGLEFL